MSQDEILFREKDLENLGGREVEHMNTDRGEGGELARFQTL